jgi:hypothetical protein
VDAGQDQQAGRAGLDEAEPARPTASRSACRQLRPKTDLIVSRSDSSRVSKPVSCPTTRQ